MSEDIMNGLSFELFSSFFFSFHSFFLGGVGVCSDFQAESNSLQGSKRNALKAGIVSPQGLSR